MVKAKKKAIFTTLCFIAGVAVFIIFTGKVRAGTQTITNIAIDPVLEVSSFSPYKINADISDNPTEVTVEILGINQDGGSYWNYYADGSTYTESIVKTMTDVDSDENWISSNIYPDNIYPEIFFAPSSITWNNVPSDINTRRANYHLLHFDNSFVMEASSTFFIELNATPYSTVNSADLSVYLVSKNKTASFFNSDWRNSADVALVGVIARGDAYSHTHVSGYSAHYLITLSANDDGTVSSKNLDISGDFWVIIYANSPNINRGWNLKYHDSAICDNTDSWYIGNQAGWTTTAQ